MDVQSLAMITVILQAIIISGFAFLLSLFSYFLDFCFWDKNIFGFWLPLLARQITKRTNKAKYDYILKFEFAEKRNEFFINEVETHPLFKVLGGCSICLNIWIGLVTFPAIHILTGFSWWFYPYYLLFASFILRKLMKID